MLRFALRLFAGLLAVIGAYFGAAVLGALFSFAPPPDEGPQSHEIVLAAGPIHYDILLPASAEVLDAFGFTQRAGVPLGDSRVRWLVLGWGSRAFYTTAGDYTDVTTSAVWTAATGDSAVLRVDVAGDLSAVPSLRRLRLTQDQFEALIVEIQSSIEDQTPLTGLGLMGTDAFFPAKGRFDIFRTCNVWVSKVLNSAGVRMGWWTPPPYSVTLSLWANGHLD